MHLKPFYVDKCRWGLTHLFKKINKGVRPLLFFVFVLPYSLRADGPLVHDKVPDFTFVERSGEEMKLSDLRGQVWIADFIFTRCQGMCPMLSGRMATFQEKLPSPNVKLVSFSVDPGYDTPEVLKEYAARFKAQEGKWFFLTGPKQKMWSFVTNGFFLGVEKPTPEELKQGAEPVIHSGRFVLVDQEGNIRGYYDSSEPAKVEELVQDAMQLASSLRGRPTDGPDEAISGIASLRPAKNSAGLRSQ